MKKLLVVLLSLLATPALAQVSFPGGVSNPGPGGSNGTVNIGTGNQLGYYATSGTAISGNANATLTAAGILSITGMTATGAITQTYTGGVWNTGQAGPGAIINRIDRLLVGTATLENGNLVPVTPDWAQTLYPNTTSVAQMASISPLGEIGVFGASRTSDFGNLLGSASTGSEGAVFIGYNDDTTHAGSISVGALIDGIRKVGSVGIAVGIQLDIQNYGSVLTISPYGGIPNNSTVALLINSGNGVGSAPNNASVGIVLGSNQSAKFEKGIIIGSAVLDVGLGQGGAGVAIEFADKQSQRWLKSDLSLIGEIFASSSLNGLALFGANMQFLSSNNWNAPGSVATVLGSIGPAGSHTTVQTWFTIVDNNGVVRYIPGF